MVTIVIKPGTTITYTVTKIDSGGPKGCKRYNNTVTLAEESFLGFFRKTTLNSSYWEKYCQFDGSCHREEDIIVQEQSGLVNFMEGKKVQATYNYSSIYKWDWTTGWPVYSYSKTFNESMVEYEHEWVMLSKTTTTTILSSISSSITSSSSRSSGLTFWIVISLSLLFVLKKTRGS